MTSTIRSWSRSARITTQNRRRPATTACPSARRRRLSRRCSPTQASSCRCMTVRPRLNTGWSWRGCRNRCLVRSSRRCRSATGSRPEEARAMTHATLRPEFEDLIDPYAPVGQVGTGFTFTEGPIWHPRDHYLLFSDMPADVRRRWDTARGVAEVRGPSNKCNGMTYDADLNLIVCEHATSSLVRERPDGRREVLASHFEGQELNSPHDVCIRSDGSIYFSDPYFGRMPVYGVERPRQLGFQGVYRVPPSGGGLQLVVDRDLFEQPNGLCLSPDERLLYVNDSAKKLIRVFNVARDGSLSGERLFASEIRSSSQNGGPDGMKCDERGNVWVTGPGGVWVYAPSGELIGKLHIPEVVANLAWGGPELRTLFLTATKSVYRVTTKIGPRIEPYMRAHAAANDPG